MKPRRSARDSRLNDIVVGRYQAARKRGGYLVPDDPAIADIRIPERGSGSVLDGDQATVRIYRCKPGRVARGEIVTVMRRAHRRIAGRIERNGKSFFLIPGNPKLDLVVQLALKNFRADEVGLGVWGVAEIRKWPATDRIFSLKGDLVEILGQEDEQGFPILLRLNKDGMGTHFNSKVQAEAQALGQSTIGATDIEIRRDLRGERIFTIDPVRAKDFDDAVQLIDSSGDGWMVGVHIADVAHYIQPGSAIDVEAHERATSVYPVDRVIPMLPESLSNNLCSLRPGEDKLTMSVSFRVRPDGSLDKIYLFESVIHSVRRFSYEDVQALLDGRGGKMGAQQAKSAGQTGRHHIPKALEDDLMELHEAAGALRGRRFGRGALQLDLPEPEFIFDESGNVTDLVRRKSNESRQLIEEFMIAANEAVSRQLEKSGYPALFRVHDKPEDSAFKPLLPALERMGIRIPPGRLDIRECFQQILNQALAKPARNVIQRWLLRVMMRAEYRHVNIGHFGLASDSYVHFTSPIRRYPDLVNHRIVRAYIRGVRPGDMELGESTGDIGMTSRHASRMEERAQMIEWDAQAIYSMQFMKLHLGSVFKGFVSGVARVGLFVELLDYPVEGLIRVAMLDDDYYELDEVRLLLRGRNRGKCFGVGDPLKVMVEKVNIHDGLMSLILIDHGRKRPVKKKRTTRRNA